MKTKTLIELITLSSSLYVLGRDTHLFEKFNEWTEDMAKDMNGLASKSMLDENGEELELIDKVKIKAEHLKEELESKIEEVVAKVYKKISIAHLDDIKALQVKLDKADAKIALLEARMNQLEAKL
jgi:BMFP domain-containing protein YqiC